MACLLCAIGSLAACHSKNRSPEAPAAQTPAFPAGETMWVTANGHPLKATIYKSAKLSPHPILIVVLHGDLLEARIPPSYHYVFSRMGHSGGATISGDLIGRQPGKVNAALLVSCPCDVPAWRHHMVKERIQPYRPAFFPIPSAGQEPVAA